MSWKKLSEQRPNLGLLKEKMYKVYKKDGLQDTIYYHAVTGFSYVDVQVVYWDELDPAPPKEPTNQEKYNELISNYKDVVKFHRFGSVSDNMLLTSTAALLVNIMNLQVEEDD